MEPIKVVRSIGDAVLEIVLWPTAIVTTVSSAAFLPWCVQRRIATEWSKPDGKDRFVGTCPPVLCWLIAVVLPYYWLIDRLVSETRNYHVALGWFYEQLWPLKLLIVSLLLATGPASAAKVAQRSLRQPTDHGTLQRHFLTQCLALTPAYLTLWLLLLCGLFAPPGPSALKQTLVLVAVSWAFYAEAGVIFAETSGTRWQRFETAYRCVGTFLTQSILLMLLIGAFLVLVRSDLTPPNRFG